MGEEDEKAAKKKKAIKIRAAVGIFLVFFFGWIFLFLNNKKSTKKLPPQSETQEESTTDESKEKKGLGVSRSEIIDYFEKNDFGFIFEPADPVDGLENQIGIKGSAFVQVVGFEDEPVYASINGYYGAEGPNFLSKADVFGFGTIFDKNANDWLENQFTKLDTQGCIDFEEKTEFGPIEYSLTCNEIAPNQNMLSLSVSNLSAKLSF